MIWIAVHSNPKSEATANHWLKQAGYETLYLYYEETVRHARRAKQVERPYFPCYIFVAVDPSQGLPRRDTRKGIQSILGFDGPEEIPEAVIAELRGRGDASGLCVLTPKERELRKRLRKGDKMLINGGSFTGLLGTVIMDSGPAVKLWVAERMKVFVRPEQLSPAGAAHGGR